MTTMSLTAKRVLAAKSVAITLHNGSVINVDLHDDMTLTIKGGKAKKPGRKRKTATVAEPTETPPPVAVAPMPEPTGKSGRRRWFPRRKGEPIEVTLDQCKGVAIYTTKKGDKKFEVAIYKTGLKDGKTFYILLFIDKVDKTKASHDSGGFRVYDGLSDIVMFDKVAA